MSSKASEEEPDQWEIIHDPQELERLLLERNHNHFGQAEGTPPTDPALQELLEHGYSDYSDQILEGTADIENVPCPQLKRLFQYLSNNNLPPISCKVTAEDLIAGYSNWNERTSTSYHSGLDLGHYKATTGKFESPTKAPDGTEIPTASYTIMDIQARLLNKAVECGHVFQRWLKVTSAMLEKIPGTPLLHKLRVIHLFEADLNLLTGIWSRRLAWNAENHNAYNTEQWGSASGQRASDVALMKRFTYTYAELTRTDLGSFDNDAKSCFDRMIVALVVLRNRHLGLPKEAAIIRAKFLQLAQYHIKTRKGMSSDFYSHSKDKPVHGTGQGSKPGPTDWRGQSTAGLDLLTTGGVTLADVDPATPHTTRKMDGFVDDKTAWANLAQQLTDDPNAQAQLIDHIHNNLQSIAQEWEQILTAMGGKLELSKCFYYMIQWVFDEHGRPSMAPPNPKPLSIQDSISNETVTITQLPTKEPHRTLGAFLCPAEDEIHGN